MRKQQKMETKLNKTWKNLEAAINERGGNGHELVTALRDLYSIWDEGLYIWLAKLYDPKVGGFYYSNSARDNEGFLPDIESTLQASGIISRSGMFESGADFPEEMKRQIGDFLLSCFDPEDGYFYHKQWGKNIIDARRGRDLMWATSMCKRFGVKLPAPTADERLRAAAEAASADESKDITENLPDYLRSREAFTEYLKRWDWDGESYVAGNNLVAQGNQIVAAGLGDVAIEFLNSIQNPETGLWGSKPGYYAINGFLKITSFYVIAKSPVRHAYKAAMAAMDALTTDEVPTHVCSNYNVWFAIGNLLEIFHKLADFMNEEEVKSIRRGLLLRAPEAIRATKEKILIFKKPDGSFSYTPTASSWVSQNAHVAVKNTNEGDVNASIICSVETLHKIYRALELEEYAMPIFSPADYEKFLKNVNLG